MVAFTLRIYYRLKIQLLKPFVGNEAIALVLYNAIFPWLVLEIGGAKLGRNVRVQRWLTIHESGGSFKRLVIGDDVYIGKFVLVDLTAPVTIGNRVGIGMFSKVFTHQNLGDSKLSETYPKESGPLTIPDDVVISTDSILLYPTQLVTGTIVSAGSIVRGVYNKPCVLIGNPARVVNYPSAQA